MKTLAINREFWRGKRVFMTGHTGFKGSWLSLWLQQLGADVTGFALNPPTKPSHFEVAKVGEGMRSIIADIRSGETLAKAMLEMRPQIVFHMAAQSLVRHSYKAPVETYATNVMGTVHLFEAIRRVDTVRAIVNVTSDKCYENKEWLWGYRENDSMGGCDPYSNSKGCAELVTHAYRNSYFHPKNYQEHGVALASARAGNVIGGGDWAEDRLIPDVMRAFAQGKAVNIRNPSAIRPWQHVLEPLLGYQLLAERLFEDGSNYAEGWNFGPSDDDAKPVGWIVERMAQSWGEGATWTLDDDDHPHEAKFLKLDCSKARSRLGWLPHWSLSETLDHVVDWYRAWQAGVEVRSMSLNQIYQYEDRVC